MADKLIRIRPSLRPDPFTARNRLQDARGASILTDREEKVVHLVAEGLTNKQIAEKLYLSFHTVKTHRKNIIKKLGFTFKNTAEFSSLIQSYFI